MTPSTGIPVIAVTDGYAHCPNYPLGGASVVLEANDGRYYYYAHLENGSRTCGNVSKGQAVGTIGCTGNASCEPGAIHLHWAVSTQWAFDQPNLCASAVLDDWLCGNEKNCQGRHCVMPDTCDYSHLNNCTSAH